MLLLSNYQKIQSNSIQLGTVYFGSLPRFLIHIKNAEIRAYPIIAIENILFTNLNQLRVFSISKTASLEVETVRYPIVSRKISTRQVEGKPLLRVFPNLREGRGRRTGALVAFHAPPREFDDRLPVVLSFLHGAGLWVRATSCTRESTRHRHPLTVA